MQDHKIVFLLSLAFLSFIPLAPQVQTVSAADPTRYFLFAHFAGWNASQPVVNPTIQSVFLFVGESFTVTAQSVDTTHNLAYYQPGTLSQEVSFPTEPNAKRLASTADIRLGFSRALTFTFQAHGFFEYYCEYHPLSMHGKVRVLRSPDINRDRVVNILDLVIVATVFLTTPTSPNWRPDADLNFDNVVNILDLVIVAANMFRTL